MFTEQQFSPRPFGKITKATHDEHLKLYAGYVKNANSIIEKTPEYLQWSEKDPFVTYFTGELRRRLSFEYNGMRNHEVYFALLSGEATPLPADSTLAQQLTAQWGSLDAFTAAFVGCAASTRGIGWTMLSWDATAKTLLLHWIDEQHLGQLQGTTPLIALDLWEHSYVADYQPSGKKQYIQDFLTAVNWSQAQANFEAVTNKI
ncbi:MAG TPA: Fe-Mn family superoxide dismutase [Candidatus Paceibacterota bacterium]|jgi:Fe-Mn family superoxide dismutase|nr:Fe-Mn family superoxide dismutase [Candidatus Paceibacterota bacterium]